MPGSSSVSNEGVAGRDALANYRKFALRACKDFSYPQDVYDRVKNAKTETQIEQIMYSARNNYLKD